jgi:hypothetical protein
VVLPSLADATAWYVDAARAALDAGERLDAFALSLFITLSPGDERIGDAIARVEDALTPDPLLALARQVCDCLPIHGGVADATLSRQAVTALEEEVLRRYRPGYGLGRFDHDAAVASALVRAFFAGHDAAHLMMAEELALTALRRYDVTDGPTALSAASEIAVVLWQLAEPAEKPKYRDRARQTLTALSACYQQHGWRAAAFISALHAIR